MGIWVYIYMWDGKRVRIYILYTFFRENRKRLGKEESYYFLLVSGFGRECVCVRAECVCVCGL